MSSIKMDLSLEDSKGTIRRRTSETKELNTELEKAQRLTKSSTSGSSAVKSAYMATQKSMDSEEYNRARGTAGNTGAGARDFARQAQGLDGLVRLYAIYAANLFAVSAAFTALSNAMDTTNMIKGLDQLGAASGVAMGSLAKQFAAASGGAISLRESMEATAKAVSSGLSQGQFLKLGEVAKKASQALGINMSDAVSRLTRGITKLEPELLDELGIFTKVGKATEDYARSIGKPVSALTDFERRQSFANAVLAEGAKKFGEIEVDTNPYSKLLATLKDVGQVGLEIVNTVLAPFAKLLSSNTTVLVGILALIGTKLVSDALPALGQWRKGIKDAATQANVSSSNILESFGEKFVERTNAAFKVPQLQRELKNIESEYAKSRTKFLAIDQAYSDKQKKNKFYSTFAAGGEVSPQDMQREINRLTKQGTSASLAAAEALKANKAEYVQLINLRERLTNAEDKAQAKADRPSVGESLRTRISKNAASRSERLDILSRVSDNFAQGGFGDAFGKLREEVAGSKTLGVFGKFRTVVTGTMIAATNAVGLFVSAFSGIFNVVGLIAAAFSFIVPMFRSNEEAADRFSASIDGLKDSNENAYRVMQRLSKLDPLEALSIPALQAKATALEGLGSSLIKSLDDFEKEVSTRNWADSTVNFIAGVFGKNSEEKLAAQLSSSVKNAVELAGSSSQAQEIKKQLALLVSLPADSSLTAISKAVQEASPVIQKEVAKIIDKFGKNAVRGTGSFTAFNESLVESGKIYQELLGTFKNSTPLTKFAEDSTKKLLELTKVLDNGTIEERLTGLAALSQNINFLQLLPPDSAGEIVGVSNALAKLNQDYANSEQAISALNTGLEVYTNLLAEEKSKGATSDFGAAAKKLEAAIRNINSAIGEQKNRQSGIASALEGASQKFANAMGAGLSANIDTFTKGLQNAAAKASVELKKTYLEGVSDPRIKARMETKLEIQAINLDAELIKGQIALVDSNANLRLAIMEQTQEYKLLAAMSKTGQTKQQVLADPLNKELADSQTMLDTFRANKGKSLAELKAQVTPAIAAGTDKSGRANAGADPRVVGPSTAVQQGLGEAIGTAQSRLALETQLKQFAGRKNAANVSGQFKQLDAEAQVRTKSVEDRIAEINQEKANLATERKALTDDEYALREASLNIRLSEFEATKMLIGPEKDLAKARISAKTFNDKDAADTLKYAQDSLSFATKQADQLQSGVEQTSAINVNTATRLKLLETENKLTTDKYDKDLQTLSTELEVNAAQQALLQTKQSLGVVSEQEFKTQSDILNSANLQLTSARELLQARSVAAAKLSEINKREAEASAGGPISGKTAAEIAADRAKVVSDLALQESGIRRVLEVKKQDLKLIEEQTKRQTAYTDLFTGAFKSMEDAIVEFTKTGKLSFSSMIESFLEGLLRFEIQKAQSQVFDSMGGARGLANFAISLFGGSTQPEQLSGPGMTEQAKGGAWDYGIQAFAKGGMFTNSIVDSPTMFKFAKGTGLMGEAGPEAIMPLTRDGSGNLGVRAQGGGSNVDVVVNNYGSEKATTKETVDSRGNRRIEVTVGDMVAQEVTRTGSAAQTAFSSTYGTRPALARR